MLWSRTKFFLEAYDDHIAIHVADKDKSQNNLEGKYLHGPLWKYCPFHNEWIDVSSYLKTITIKGFEDYQKKKVGNKK